MNKTIKFYGILFLVVMILLGLLIGSKKEITDWSKNFDITKKTPFGLFVFNEEAEEIFNHQLERIYVSPYDYYQEDRKPHNILFIEHDTDKESWKKVLKQVSEGSDLMYISDNQNSNLLDTIQDLIPRRFYTQDYYGVMKFTDSSRTHKVEMDRLPGFIGYTKISKNLELLGIVLSEEEVSPFANFVKLPYGKGNIYYHTEPLFVTNYHLLRKNDYQYAQDVFSYLPERETVWFIDEIEKTDLLKQGHPLGFVFKNPPLKYAWWVFLAGILFLMIFRAKRTQRIIPIIVPKKNKSVEFVKSIGNLYIQEGNIQDMMRKKTLYFLHHLRTELFINTQKLDEEFIKKLHLKTGESEENIKELIELINKSEKEYSDVNKEDLLKLDKIIDNILKK